MARPRRTRKLRLALAVASRLRLNLGGTPRTATADAVYAGLAAACLSWDPETGWLEVDEPVTGVVGVRLEGTFRDVVAWAKRHGLAVSPRRGRGGQWLAYADAPSGLQPRKLRRAS